jgi:segregation and condensation protein B
VSEQQLPVTGEPARPDDVLGAPDEVSGAVEALLLLAEEPMAETTLAAALGVPVPVVRDTLLELVAFYDETGRGFELRELGGGWRYYTRDRHADLVSAFVLEGRQSKLSQASLETLAVVAYQQPISRARVSAVRGVNVDAVMKTLLARGLVQEVGSDEVSGAVLFGTTNYFLERMGLRTLDDLPPLAPHLPEVDQLEAELSRLAEPGASTRSAGGGESDAGRAGGRPNAERAETPADEPSRGPARRVESHAAPAEEPG